MTYKCLVCGKEAEHIYDTLDWRYNSRICHDCNSTVDPRLIQTLLDLDNILKAINIARINFDQRCNCIKPFMLGKQKYVRDKLENLRSQVQELMNELRQPKPSEEIEKLKAIVEV